jgi:hypothetical protein
MIRQSGRFSVALTDFHPLWAIMAGGAALEARVVSVVRPP